MCMFSKPEESRASLMALTIPSIMPEGASISAPFFAWDMACFFRFSRVALKEVLLVVQEGADLIMVKPALAYLDIIAKVKEATLLPVCAYNVSGENAMIKAGGRLG